MTEPAPTGRALGAQKTAAAKCGVTLQEWQDRRRNGEAWCFACKRFLPIGSFNIDRSRSTGRATRCRPCMRIATRRTIYALTTEQLLTIDVSPCAICDRIARKMVADHDHTTGQFRGVLCNSCNIGLGLFDDDAGRFQRAIDYLAKSNSSPRLGASGAKRKKIP